MKKTPLVFRGKIPLYDIHLVVGIGDTLQDARNILPKFLFPDREDIAVSHCKACTMYNDHTCTVAMLFKYNKLKARYLAHEITHAAGHVFQIIGQEKLAHGSEVYAYLCDWITGWVYRQLKKRGIEVLT